MSAAALVAGLWLPVNAAAPAEPRPAQPAGDPTSRLLAALDLDRPGLEKVRAARGQPGRAATELLAHYRARTGVKHPQERPRPGDRDPKELAAHLREVADDALRNVLIASPHYPRFDFGKEIDWLTNRAPNRDKEWLWQLNRHSSWGALAAAWRRTGDEKYARGYVRQLVDWIGKCPRDADSPAWRTIEAGIRGCAWTGHFQAFVDSPAYTPEVLVRHLASFQDHAEYLTGRPMNTSNWGLMEAEGAAFVAMTFPEFHAAPEWRRKAFAHLNAMMKKQVRADGHQYEQCLGYHLGAIDWFARTARMAADNGLEQEFAPEYWKRIESMCEVPARLGFPDGSHTQFGDDHSQFNWRARIAPHVRLYRREDLLFAATGGREGRAPAETAFALRDSGFYSMRSGWDAGAVMLVLKCGPDGGWHGQPDNNTFEVFAGGRRLTPDSGSYVYHGDDAGRKWFQQTRVHATLTLDGRDTASAPRLLLWKPGAELDVLVVENGSYEGFTHRRAVLFVGKRFFVLVDEALGPAKGGAWLHFQLPPGSPAPDAAKLSARSGFPDGANLLIAAGPQAGLRIVPEDGQVSFEYGRKEPRPALRFELDKGEAPVRFVTALVPWQEKAPEVKLELVGNAPPGAKKVELDVTVDGEKRRVGYELP